MLISYMYLLGLVVFRFVVVFSMFVVFFFKQKTAYEMRISDWSSDVCSSDLTPTTSPPAASAASAITPIRPTRPPPKTRRTPFSASRQIGRASCRERVCQYV